MISSPSDFTPIPVLTDAAAFAYKKLIFEKITNAENEIKALCGKLDALSPLKVLKRGYAFVSDENGTAIKNADNVKINDVINVRLCGGRLLCDVREVSNE